MKRSELKEMIKPLVKECVQETILNDGLLSSIVSEVAHGMGNQFLVENKEEVVEFYMQNALNTDPNIHLKDTVPGWKEDMMNIHLDDLSTSAAKRYFTYKNVRSLQLYKMVTFNEMDPDILLGFKNHVYNYNNSLIADNYKNKDLSGFVNS